MIWAIYMIFIVKSRRAAVSWCTNSVAMQDEAAGLSARKKKTVVVKKVVTHTPPPTVLDDASVALLTGKNGFYLRFF